MDDMFKSQKKAILDCMRNTGLYVRDAAHKVRVLNVELDEYLKDEEFIEAVKEIEVELKGRGAESKRKLLDAMRRYSLYAGEAFAVVGVERSAFHDWMCTDPEFYAEVRKVEKEVCEAKVRALKGCPGPWQTPLTAENQKRYEKLGTLYAAASESVPSRLNIAEALTCPTPELRKEMATRSSVEKWLGMKIITDEEASVLLTRIEAEEIKK